MEVKEEYLLFLDELRENGVVNMFGAAPHLRQEFPELSKYQAKQVVKKWMNTFKERNQQ